MKILILYYSGVGNTKMVAAKIFALLQDQHEVTIASIEKLSVSIAISQFDALVIGFFTIHASPAQPVLTFINQLEPLQHVIPTYVFTTCGLYSANALRIFVKKCRSINIIPMMSRSYRCAATDGSLIAPFMNFWFRHEIGLDEKVLYDVYEFIRLLVKPIVLHVPRFKLYSILNYPNKIMGQRFSPRIYTHKENCSMCGKCILNCPVQSITKDDKGYPMIKASTCIHCYRCIHHCSCRVLSLSKKHPPAKTLYY